MIITLEEYYLFTVSVRSCRHYRKRCNVVTVLCKERPIRAFYGIDQKLRKVYHKSIRECGAVRYFSLLCRGGVNVGIVITKYIRAVSTHIVNKTVSVQVPEIRALSL